MLAGALALFASIQVASPTPAHAHPHVWVNVETTVLYDQGKVTGFTHRWTFDDMYTAMAVQGLDKNQDGTFTREELAELAQVNIDGLKEFEFFTFARVKESPVKLAPPKDYWLEHKNGVLSLNFTLPIAEPVPAETEGFEFAVYDQTFFIAFDLAKENPVRLSDSAPAGCSATVGNSDKDLADLQKLNDAFGGQLTAGNANEGSGLGYASTIHLSCAKT
ncbi:MAG: DUF1007 family protein [Hyphomicrobium sp.]|nr:DUF1007 family protein [Hyphomicrobium sp.]